MYNAGDILIARKTVYMVERPGKNITQLPMLFKDKKYMIASGIENGGSGLGSGLYYINTEYKENHTFQLQHIYEYFYTKQEERKLKIKNLSWIKNE